MIDLISDLPFLVDIIDLSRVSVDFKKVVFAATRDKIKNDNSSQF